MRRGGPLGWLLLANLILLTLVLGWLLWNHSAETAAGAGAEAVATRGDYDYRDNYKYDLIRGMFRIYRPQKIRVVMLGDSLTYKADWNELLSRTDVANRGIGADTTEGYLNRLSDLYPLEPGICFVMGGINDLLYGIDVETVFGNLVGIVKELEQHGITPVLQSVLMLSRERKNWRRVNPRVARLNDLLRRFARESGIGYIDLNPLLSDGQAMKPEYSIDGLHLTARAYGIWRNKVLEVLERETAGQRLPAAGAGSPRRPAGKERARKGQ